MNKLWPFIFSILLIIGITSCTYNRDIPYLKTPPTPVQHFTPALGDSLFSYLGNKQKVFLLKLEKKVKGLCDLGDFQQELAKARPYLQNPGLIKFHPWPKHLRDLGIQFSRSLKRFRLNNLWKKEKLVYEFSYLGFVAGEIQVETNSVGPESQVWATSLRVKSNQKLDKIYSLNNIMTSYFDFSNFRTLKLVHCRKESKYRGLEAFIWGPDSSQNFFIRRLFKNHQERFVAVKFHSYPTSLDFVSFFYYLRGLASSGMDNSVAIIGNKSRNIIVKIKKVKKNERWPNGNKDILIDVYNISAYLPDNVSRNVDIIVGITKGRNNIPVYFVAKTPIGSFKSQLSISKSQF